MTLKNFEMEKRVMSLKNLLPHRDKVGYVAARNTRILGDSLTEYYKFKDELVRKYGTVDKDENGNDLPTVQIKYSDENFEKFSKELEDIGNIEHSVTLMTMKYDEVVGLLSGEEILENDWMFED